MKKARLRIPASTSNIGPGFDTLGLALNLYNYLEMEEIDEGVIVHCEGEGAERLGEITPEESLPYRAAKEVFQSVGHSPHGLKISFINNIPLGRGLGSSGAVCVGSIAAAFLLAGLELNPHLILELALRLERHPDNITPSLVGGFTVSCISQGKVFFVKISVAFPLKIVAIIPELELPTQESRRVLATHIPFEDAQFNLNRTALLVAGFATGNSRVLMEGVKDKLHQPHRAELLPGLYEVFDEGYLMGALGCFLSGAGSSIIALTQNNARQVGHRMSTLWQKKFGIPNRWQVFQVDNEGLVQVKTIESERS
ncbi:MAG: homoserine kinase [Deltaproteobacteria bacterium]|nr:homoserine kinase [Deltaproteobacteria bacterium]